MFDAQGNEVFNNDLQNESEWCKHGASIEEVFVEKLGEKLYVILNPEKETNPSALDLLNTEEELLSDLKTQDTPFFSAEEK
jgi:hypothetical protein